VISHRVKQSSSTALPALCITSGRPSLVFLSLIIVNNRLKELREKALMTQEELAIRAGVSRQTIISLEKGRYNPSITLAYKLSRIFGLSIEEVFLLNEMEGE
jgi:putative transcriptional regulator